jgi:hypothetical protein
VAQLRCAQTGELLAEGTPLEIVTAAAKFPDDEVMYDDVGAGFDPDAVRKARADEIAGLQAALDELPAKPSAADRDRVAELRDGLKATIAERQERIEAGKELVPDARQRMEEARDLRDRALADE